MVNTRNVLLTFAEELTKRMEQKGVTYRQVAFAARVTKGSIIHYKSGNCFPELWTLVLISAYLDCSVDELLGYFSSKSSRNVDRAIEPLMDEDCFEDYFRDRLLRQMELENISPEQLSAKTGIKPNIIEMYLSVHRWVPRVPEFLNICSALDCTPSDLLGY